MRWLNKPVPKAVECLFPTTFSRILIFSGANHPDFIGCIGCIHTCALTSNLSKIRHFDKNLAKRILYCCEKKGVNHRWICTNHANNDEIFLRFFYIWFSGSCIDYWIIFDHRKEIHKDLMTSNSDFRHTYFFDVLWFCLDCNSRSRTLGFLPNTCWTDEKSIEIYLCNLP